MVGLAELYPGTEVQISYKGKRGLATGAKHPELIFRFGPFREFSYNLIIRYIQSIKH